MVSHAVRFVVSVCWSMDLQCAWGKIALRWHASRRAIAMSSAMSLGASRWLRSQWWRWCCRSFVMVVAHSPPR
eukprot:7131877-Pyramimonas_sp.AAC.1